MSCEAMVALWLQGNEVSRFNGYTGTPKRTKQILFNSTKQKRQRVLMSERDVRRINKFGKYIERNF